MKVSGAVGTDAKADERNIFFFVYKLEVRAGWSICFSLAARETRALAASIVGSFF